MSAWIFFIGGSSASGKSTVANEIAKTWGLPVIRIDNYRDIIDEINLPNDTATAVTKALSLQVVTHLVCSGAQCVVEGAWITPAQASKFRQSGFFHPVFCGYPNADPARRYDIILSRGGSKERHWLCARSRNEAIAFLRKKIASSVAEQVECNQFDIKFVDCTDFGEGASEVLKLFEHQWQLR